MRWVAPFLLLLAGWWLEWGPGKRPGSGWGITLLGLLITYAGIAGAAQVAGVSGGRIGRFLASTLTDLFGPQGAFVLMIALAVFGVIVGFGIPLRQLTRPAVGTARWMGTTAAASLKRTPAEEAADAKSAAAAAAAATATVDGKGRATKAVPVGPGTVARPDRRVGRGGRDPGRGAERRPELGDVRPGARRRRRGRRDGSPGPTAARPRRRHRRGRFAADQGPDRLRPAAAHDARGHRHPARGRRRRGRSTCATRRSSSRSWRASASRPRSSAATRARS